MIDLSTVLDRYSRQARLYPALLVLVPVPMALLTWFPDLRDPLGLLFSLAAACGAVYLLAQLGRDRGKAIEPSLFKEWGGKPSVALLRWSDQRIDRFTKQGYHTCLAAAIATAKFPNAAEELADPGLADEAYEAATKWLLQKTRDTKVYRLLFNENISYGFRRNLLGLRVAGIAVSLAVAALSTGAAIERYTAAGMTPSTAVVIASAIAWVAAAWWVFGVRASWVRIPADQYGIQLLAACTDLAEPVKAPLVTAAGASAE
jgi:hypothetical protein